MSALDSTTSELTTRPPPVRLPLSIKFEKLLPVVGGFVLLIAWCYQQMSLDPSTARGSKLAAAEAAWDEVHKDDRIVGMLHALATGKGSQGSGGSVNKNGDWEPNIPFDALEDNCERAEKLVTDAVGDSMFNQAKSEVFQAFDGGSGTRAGVLELRLATIKRALALGRAEVNLQRLVARRTYGGLYAAGALAVLIGTALRARTELRAARASRESSTSSPISTPH